MPRQESDSLIHHIKSEIRAPSVELYLNKQRSPENGVFIFSEETGGASSLPIFLAPMLCTILDLISRMQQHLKQLLLHSSLTSCMLSHFRRRQWHPTPVLLPGKSHGQGSLVGCSPWGRQQSDTTEQRHFLFSLSCIGEGNGNPLQCSCLENPRDRGAWWAAVYGVTQSWTRLKPLSSSSSIV